MSALLVLVALALPIVALLSRQHTRNTMRATANDLGLTYTQGGWLGHDELAGMRNGVAVTVRYFHKGSNKHRVPWTRVTASGPPRTLSLKRQHVGSTLLRKVTGGDDLIVGDPSFDGDIVVEGEPSFLAAALDLDTRRAVQLVVGAQGGSIEDGRVTVEHRSHITAPGRLGPLVDEITDLAVRLSDPLPDPAGRLRRIALSDPAGGVRSRALRSLRRWHDAPTAAAVADAAKDDPDPSVRVQAALILGEPLAPFGPDALRLFAPEDPESLARTLVKEGAEELLVALLTVEDAATRGAACTGLARVGTVRSIEALVPLTKGLFADDRVKEAARRAVESIRARLGDVDAGRLTMVDPAQEGGGLSIAREAGAVSIARKERP